MIEKNFYRIALLAAIVYILFLRMCNECKTLPAQVIVKRDTAYIDVFRESGWIKPEPDTVIRIKTIRDTIGIEKYYEVPASPVALEAKYRRLLEEYSQKSYYEETFTTEYGDIVTMDSVYNNRLMAHRIATNFKVPVVNTTTAAKQRNQLYAGFGAFGGRSDLLKGIELNLTLKNKRDQMYELGGVMLNDGNYYLKAGMKFKISFRKK